MAESEAKMFGSGFGFFHRMREQAIWVTNKIMKYTRTKNQLRKARRKRRGHTRDRAGRPL